jgi:hypothetical protein
MPKASVLKSKYRVSEGPITDISRFGIYIEKECKNYATFWLEKKVGDGKNVTLLTSSYMNRGDFGYLYHRHHKFSRDQCNLPRKKP